MEKVNLIIIGGGAGAFAAAIRANELKTKTVMVNSGLPLGGTCVNVGCVPSKSLLHAGEMLHLAKNHGIPGIKIEVKNCDFKRIIQDEIVLVERMREEKYEKVLKNLEYVRFVDGKARFVSQNEIEVNGEKLFGDRFMIATGSTARVPDIEGIFEVGFITHIEALRLESQPKELAVVGAGPLGLEFAQMYSRFGTKVTILQRSSSIFPRGENRLTARLRELLLKEGIEIKTNVEVKKALRENDKKVLSYTIDAKGEEVSADEILLAAGKVPNTSSLNLHEVGVHTDENRAVIVDDYFQTSQSHIFAVGDVTNLPLRLEQTAGREGSLAAENILTGAKKRIDYKSVPYTIFTDPQLAGVGFTEEEQIEEIGNCACRTVSLVDVPKARIIRRTEGLINMTIHPSTKRIMGVHILSPNAGDLIAEAMVLIRNQNTIDDVISSLPVFPTLSEAIKLAALSFTKDISSLSCCI